MEEIGMEVKNYHLNNFMITMKTSISRENIDLDIKMLDLKSYPVVDKLADFRVLQNTIEALWESSNKTQYFHTWLRENCACNECRDPSTLEKSFDLTTVSDDIFPRKLSLSNGFLEIIWSDNHKSSFEQGWLYAHQHPRIDNSTGRKNEASYLLPNAVLPAIDYDQYMNNDINLLDFLKVLIDNGVGIIENVPTENNYVATTAKRISFLRETNYGTTFDVHSVPNPISGAYSSRKLHPHTDLPNHELPPGFQFFHCLENNAVGGETVLVDGFRIANALKKQSHESYKLLSTHPMQFRLLDEGNDRTFSANVIRLNYENDYYRIRYSKSSIAPYIGPAEIYPKLRLAYNEFSKLVDNPEYQLTIKLLPGQLLITDNYRILHGRNAFDLTTGRRHLQGCYLDRAEILNRKEVLERSIIY